jgi:hypothetical protein
MAESDDLRTFIREIMARYDRGIERMDRRFEQAEEKRRRYFDRLQADQKAYHEAEREKLDEILAEGRAGRQALFRILDRLDGNGGTAAG